MHPKCGPHPEIQVVSLDVERDHLAADVPEGSGVIGGLEQCILGRGRIRPRQVPQVVCRDLGGGGKVIVRQRRQKKFGTK